MLVLAGAALVIAAILLRQFHWQYQSGQWLLPIIVAAAVVDSINPCAFSILLLTIAFMFSLGKSRRKVLAIGAVYIFGIFIVYLLIGLGILKTLQLFNVPHVLAKFGAVILIAAGLLNIVNKLYPKFPVKLKLPELSHQKIATQMEKATIGAALGLGILVGLFEFPCTGGPYLLILSLLHDQAKYLTGLSYLALYNAIFVLPLIIILLIAANAELLEKVKSWKRQESGAMRLWGGLAMIIIGLLILMF